MLPQLASTLSCETPSVSRGILLKVPGALITYSFSGFDPLIRGYDLRNCR